MKRISLFLFALLFAGSLLAQQAKYIFYFIGDGMGPNQVLLTEMYLASLGNNIDRKPLCMTQFPYSGQAATFSHSNPITDSSAAGTCLATGHKTTNGMLGVSPEGEPLTSIAAILHERGWAVGVTTSVSIDHATPGAFYAHVNARGDYYTIGTQLIDSEYEFFGGSSFLEPDSKTEEKAPNLYDVCRERNYLFAHGVEEATKFRSQTKKMILIPDAEGQDIHQPGPGRLPFAIDAPQDYLTLAQITEQATLFLEETDRNFFLMVEGGAIDWCCHGNDAATTIREVLAFDEAIQVAYQFYLRHPDETLIVVTADHETGGLALGNHKYNLHLDWLQYQRVSATALSGMVADLHKQYGKKLRYEQVQELFKKQLGLYGEVSVSQEEDLALRATFKAMMKNKATDTKTLYASLNALSDQAVRLLNKKAHLGWSTHSHSAAAVPVYAIGTGAEAFSGWHDNSYLMPTLLRQAN